MDRNMLFFCSFCRHKTDDELHQLDCHIDHSISRHERNRYIAHQGDPIRDLYMLLDGQVRTEMVSSTGIVLPVSIISAPAPLAAAFLFATDSRFPVDVIATEPCRVARIPRSAVEGQMASCPGFLRGFLTFSADRMRLLSDRIKVFGHKGIKSKVAYHILLNEHQGEFKMGHSITWLAEYFGVERPSLSRAISELVRDGIIAYRNGNGTILNAAALREMAL